MRRRTSRAAMATGLTISAFGLAAGSASAADTLYFVNAPAVTGVSALTPQSATVTGAIDTGGSPGFPFTLAAGGQLSWVGGVSALNTTTKTESMMLGGLPTTGSDADVMIAGGTPNLISNGGINNFSDVVFEYDTLQDYQASGDSPGAQTQYADDVYVPTTAGISSVKTQLGAFGLAAQTKTGRQPLTPGTKYVYWIVDQAGATNQARQVNTFNPASPTAATSVNPSYSCYPDNYIAANSYLSTLTSTGTVAGGLASAGGLAQTTAEPEILGPCVYYFGNVSALDNYTSPTGTFTTPAIGTLTISPNAAASSSGQSSVTVTDKSAYKASGSIELTTKSGAKLAAGKFAMKPGKTAVVALTLTTAGAKAAKAGTSAVVALTSDWGQTSTTKKIKL